VVIQFNCKRLDLQVRAVICTKDLTFLFGKDAFLVSGWLREICGCRWGGGMGGVYAPPFDHFSKLIRLEVLVQSHQDFLP
jgi:hypothetical protein